MKTLGIILLALLFHVAMPAQTVEELYRNRQYFDMKDALEKKLSPTENALFYEAVVANRFNDPERSISLLRKFLKRESGAGEMEREAYELLAENYVQTFQYGKAADAYRGLLAKFANSLDLATKTSDANLAGLWGALRDAPAQKISLGGEAVVQGTRDKARLLNIPVEAAGRKMDFIFDTGAGLSTMTVSTARKLGLKIIESDVSVGSSTDIDVRSKLAVAPELKIGNLIARNVVFLVMEDKTLFVPPIDYQINAIIGFPVIKAIGRVTISKNDEIRFSSTKSNVRSEPNMLLEGLKPLVAASYNNKRVIFAFDTGATGTTFYPLFYTASSDSARAAAVDHTLRSGGAGGIQASGGYKMKDIELVIGGKTALFPVAEVLKDGASERTKYYYGNLGQDLIKQYDRMTLDFISMRLTFE
jgi:Aspartyl protease